MRNKWGRVGWGKVVGEGSGRKRGRQRGRDGEGAWTGTHASPIGRIACHPGRANAFLFQPPSAEREERRREEERRNSKVRSKRSKGRGAR
jgi:hypothetical protein